VNNGELISNRVSKQRSTGDFCRMDEVMLFMHQISLREWLSEEAENVWTYAQTGCPAIADSNITI